MQFLIIALLVVVAGIGAFFAFGKQDAPLTTPVAIVENTPAPAPTQPSTNPVGDTPVASTQTTAYADGTYTQEGPYSSPAGKENLTVSLTLAKDTVTDLSIKSAATDPTSKMLTDGFIANINKLVVGKPIADINLTVVNGASLTTQGFNTALNAIKAQAQQG